MKERKERGSEQRLRLRPYRLRAAAGITLPSAVWCPAGDFCGIKYPLPPLIRDGA